MSPQSLEMHNIRNRELLVLRHYNSFSISGSGKGDVCVTVTVGIAVIVVVRTFAVGNVEALNASARTTSRG
jgi:hypothetical protein